MVASHIFYKLVISARLLMKKASWGCCVFVFDSSGEPAGHPEFTHSCAPGCSGTEFEVGRTSCEDGVGATVYAPMDYESSMFCSTCCIKGRFGSVSSLFVFRSNRSPRSGICGGGHFHRGWNKETEEIKKFQNLSSLSASSAKCVSINRLFGSRPQSNTAGAGFRRWSV